MQQIVSITSQGQLTLPKSILNEFGISDSTKALVEKKGESIVVSPRKDFWSLGGSLKSNIRLTDKQLREARNKFSSEWAKL